MSALPRLTVILSAAQHRSASASGVYVSKALQAQGFDSPEVQDQVNAAGFAGIASDGRDLQSLLQSPLIQAFQALQQGANANQALSIGASILDRIVATQTIDAGRTADGVGIAASGITGYVRIAAPPCCGRCAVLGGEFYRWSAGFERHPYCDCYHMPVTDSRTRGLGKSGMELFRSGQIKGMSEADIKAVKDGADLNQVINAHRGMMTAGGRKFTHEGMTTRGLAGKRLQARAIERGFTPGTDAFRAAAGVRLMPEQIYKEANGNRDEAIRLLRRFGFIH